MTQRPLALIQTTLPPDRADEIARTLVAERLAACVQVEPIRSLYRWRGEIEQAEEARLSIKTDERQAEALVARLRALHPYHVPEIIRLSAAVEDDYADWLRAECGS